MAHAIAGTSAAIFAKVLVAKTGLTVVTLGTGFLTARTKRLVHDNPPLAVGFAKVCLLYYGNHGGDFVRVDIASAQHHDGWPL